MKEIISKKNKKVQFVNEEEWKQIVKLGWADRFKVRDVAERKLKVPVMPPVEKKLVQPKQIKK